jgi:hypothetical protein
MTTEVKAKLVAGICRAPYYFVQPKRRGRAVD